MLKSIYHGLLTVILLTGTFTATEAAVLLEKTTSRGFVMPAYGVTSRCSLTDDGHLIQQYNLSTLMSKRVSAMQLSVINLKTMIKNTSFGMVTSEMFPVDAGTQTYRAFNIQAGVVKSVLLYEENGGTGQKRTNNAPEALILRNFIDLNCGNPLH